MTVRASSIKAPLSKEAVQSRLAAAWARTIAGMEGKKATFAEAIGCHPDTVSNALAGNTVPELHTALNSLLACPDALFEVFSLYGFRLVPDDRAMSPDMRTIFEMSEALTTYIAAMEDGRRDHRETLRIAEKVRPLLSKLAALVAEADDKKLRRVA